MTAKTFQQFWNTWVEADTQDREGCEIVWEAATKAAEEKFTDVQQLKAEILPMLCEASESLRIGDLEDGERIINEITATISRLARR